MRGMAVYIKIDFEFEGCKVVDVHFEKYTNDKPA